MKSRLLGSTGLPDEEMHQDKKRAKRFGPCGVGEKAIYLNSFFLERIYYIPFSQITRIFKRVALSKGGFSGKGMFASIPYLVVVYDNGREKQCNFKYEEQVDLLLDYVKKTHPQIRTMSETAEAKLREKERVKAARKLPRLTPEAENSITHILKARDYLEQKPELSRELSRSARRKRSFLQSKPAYGYAALAITILGLLSCVYGIFTLIRQTNSFAIYFTIFGLAAIFLFSGLSILPTAGNNKKAIFSREEKALTDMKNFLTHYGKFPVPARYAHPVVLSRMIDILEEGRAISTQEALEVLKNDLKALNSSVEVDQEEYDQIIQIKALFLNNEYR